MGPLLCEDLELIAMQTQPLWEAMRGQRLFITGGTGFFGKWLVESFCYANRQFHLNAEVTVLSRNPNAFYDAMPHLKEEPLVLHRGDVRTFEFPNGSFAFIIHAGTAASHEMNENEPSQMTDTIVLGTERVLEFSRYCGANRLLFTSSGAVYGKQPAGLTHMPETYESPPDALSPRSAYAEGKSKAEQLCIANAEATGLEVSIARCFSFIGPHLPLNRHFAIGNFMADALAGRPIMVQGDGTPYRSYLYAADLAIWLWSLLFQGVSCRPYNVGSEMGMSLLEVARLVEHSLCPGVGVQVMKAPQAGQAVARYIPNTQRAQRELNLTERINLPDALQKTAAWLKQEIPSQAF
jgi:nucleoside-diphosphate-sugar epimerase